MSRGRIVRWMLEETEIDYTTEIVAYGSEMQGASFRAINPMGKVPAIRHGEIIVTEGAAICAYLADAFPAAGLAPNPAPLSGGPTTTGSFLEQGHWSRPW